MFIGFVEDLVVFLDVAERTDQKALIPIMVETERFLG